MIIKNFALAVSAAALFTTGAVADDLLQQSSSIEQIGGLSTARVNQTGGDEGLSTIEQIGQSHSATVRQSNDPGNIAGFTVPANVSTINQRGTGATATVIQNGDRFAAQPNTSVVTQRSPLTSPGSEQVAVVRQSGTGHISDVFQNGLDNIASVSQEGIGNTSTISQTANFVDATVIQSGQGNLSTIEQSGRANNSTASVLQGDDNNVSTVLQTSLIAGPGSRDQFVRVEQTTGNNFSEITQDGGDPVFSTTDQGNRASVFQTVSDRNVSTIGQSGAGHVAIVRQ